MREILKLIVGLSRVDGTLKGITKNIVRLFVAILLLTSIFPLPLLQAAPPPYITLTFPNGGETLLAGEYYTIKWHISSDFPYPSAYIKFYYSTDGGENYTLIDCISGVFMGEPGYTWRVPNIISENCKIKVSLLSACSGSFIQFYGSDESDENFTIAYDQLYFVKDGDIKLWLPGGEETTLIHLPETSAFYPSATPAGELLAFVQVEEDYYKGPVWNTSEIWIASYEMESWRRITTNDLVDIDPAISPDGTKVVFSRFDETGQFSNLYLYTRDPFGSHLTQLTSGSHQDREACFSPDGTKIVFSSNRGGKFQLYTLNVENPESIRQALPGVTPYTTRDQRNPDWSPDGKWFACSMEWGYQSDIFMADAWGSINTRRVFQLTNTPEDEIFPAWRPDTSAIAYVKRLPAPDAYSYELWSMNVRSDSTVEVTDETKLTDLGLTPMGTEPPGNPCWRRLEGLRIIEGELEGRVNQYVDMTVEAFGGIPPYTWGISGTLPDELYFSDGRFYGTPAEAVKDTHVILNVSDSIGLHTKKTFDITIRPEHDLELLTTDRFLPPAVVGDSYSASVRFKGGLSPYEVTVESAIVGRDLPENLVVTNSTSGDIFTVWLTAGAGGFPAGRYRVKVQVIDDFGDVAAGFYDFNVVNISYWNVRDVFGEQFIVGVEGLPEESFESLADMIDISLEGRGIEQSFSIDDMYTTHPTVGQTYHTFVLPYPNNFDAWESVFNPDESTLIGTLKVALTADGATATATHGFPIHRYMFRRNNGFSFGNFHTSGISWSNFVEFFGDWECCYFGSEDMPRLIPSIIWAAGRGSMSKGMCFGMSMSANNIAEDVARARWEDHPNLVHSQEKYRELAEPDEFLDEYIEKQHWWQLSMEFIRMWAFKIAHNYGEWGEAVVDDVESYVDSVERGENPDPLILCMSYHKKGHTVVPYAIEYLPDGRALIRVYDPNKPFRYDETSDGNSSIYVDLSQDNAWTFFMGYDSDGNEIIWNNDKIYTIPWSALHGNPDLPGLLNIPELSSIGIGALFDIVFGGTAEIEQVTDGEEKTLYTLEGEINMDPETGIRDCFLLPFFGDSVNSTAQIYYASANKTYDFDIAGTENGNYSLSYMPMDGMLMSLTIDTFNNSSDKVGTEPKNLSAAFSTRNYKKFSCKMIREFEEYGKIFLISNMETDGNGNVTFAASPNGDNITVVNNGNPTSYDLEIEYIGNESQMFKHKDIHLDSGEVHRITPASWENLSKSEIRIDIDRDNDGIWDEYKLLKQKTRERTPGFEMIFLIGAIVLALILIKRRKTDP
ncbi:MAG: hypothetical protein U9O96_07825 [Candidatus Thermoplasmatota archaeon]|nr:hypothetical protein [Candidatus Thermoplasmatota archaeon]